MINIDSIPKHMIKIYAQRYLNLQSKHKKRVKNYYKSEKGKKALQKAYYRKVQKSQSIVLCSCGRKVRLITKNQHDKSQYHIQNKGTFPEEIIN